MDVLLCDPACSSWRISLEMESIAFLTFSTHSLQLPFSQHNSENEYETKGLLHNIVPLQSGQPGSQPRALRCICILRGHVMHTWHNCMLHVNCILSLKAIQPQAFLHITERRVQCLHRQRIRKLML